MNDTGLAGRTGRPGLVDRDWQAGTLVPAELPLIEGYGLQSVHKPGKIGGALAPEGMSAPQEGLVQRSPGMARKFLPFNRAWMRYPRNRREAGIESALRIHFGNAVRPFLVGVQTGIAVRFYEAVDFCPLFSSNW